MDTAKEITARIQCMGYGYQVKVLINGVDIGVKGGQSEGKGLFGRDHPMKSEATPDMQARLFVLKPGENAVHLEFKKTGGETDKLTFELFTDDPLEPSVTFSSTDPAGTFDKTFIL